MEPNTDTKKLLVSVRVAAEMLSLSQRTIENYVKSKVIPARKVGRRTLIPVRALETFVRTDHASAVSDAGK